MSGYYDGSNSMQDEFQHEMKKDESVLLIDTEIYIHDGSQVPVYPNTTKNTKVRFNTKRHSVFPNIKST